MNYLWYYDNNDSSNPQWKLHIANGNDYDYCGETLTSLKKGQGFWANAKEDCNISIGTIPDKPCVSDMPAPPDLEKPECITCDTNSSDPQPIPVGEEFTLGTYPLPVIVHSKQKRPAYYFRDSSISSSVISEGDIITVVFDDIKIQLVNMAGNDRSSLLQSEVLIINDITYKLSDYSSPEEFDTAMRALIPDDIEGPIGDYMEVPNSDRKYKVYFTDN